MEDEMSEEEAGHRPDEVYRKWFRTSSKGGFLVIQDNLEIGRFAVEIGETAGGSLTSASKGWVPGVGLSCYLDAVAAGQGHIYSANDKTGLPTAESFVHYGGGADKGGGFLSRIIKIHHYPTGKDSYDPNSFIWKVGIFEARRADQGAYIPNMSKPKSTNSIKVTRTEMAEIATWLRLSLTSFAATHADAMKLLRGKKG